MKHLTPYGILACVGVIVVGLIFMGCTGLMLIGLVIAGDGESTTPASRGVNAPTRSRSSGAIPQQAQYIIQIEGQANQAGGTVSTFAVNAALVVVPTIDPQAIGVRNGPNPVDVAIITNASPLQGEAGALWFGTNTAFCSLVGCTTGASAIDTTIVVVDSARDTVTITVDGDIFGQPTARLNIFNIFNIRTGVTAQIYNVLAGEITIQFADRGRSVSGTIDLGGNSGFSGPAVTTEYSATFSGTRSD
jgi:hypothetical protein